MKLLESIKKFLFGVPVVHNVPVKPNRKQRRAALALARARNRKRKHGRSGP